VLGTAISILVSGFLIGGLARWAVPGPDPMPVWLTIAIGFFGSLIGGGIAAAALHATRDVSSSDYFTVVLASILAAIVLVILYRRFVQDRPITGPKAHELPTKGFGIARLRSRIGVPVGPQAGKPSRAETLERLDRLHDEGVLTDEEYLEKRRQVLREPP
jgi:uncharacterized membrane protein YeaQ/YmgE (transglycosylase-associated protein family)